MKYNRLFLAYAAVIALTPGTLAAAEPYSRVDSDSMTVIDGGGWYLEEYDGLGRSVRGTRWVNGEISSLTTWLYSGESARCEVKIVTDGNGSVETRFDGQGNEILLERKTADGSLISSIERSWDADRRETARKTSAEGRVTLEEWDYDAEGRLIERRFSTDGVLALRAVYESDQNWTETVYSGGTEVYAQTYVNGRKAVKR